MKAIREFDGANAKGISFSVPVRLKLIWTGEPIRSVSIPSSPSAGRVQSSSTVQQVDPGKSDDGLDAYFETWKKQDAASEPEKEFIQFQSAKPIVWRKTATIEDLVKDFSLIRLPHSFMSPLLQRMQGVVVGTERFLGYEGSIVKRIFAEAYTNFTDTTSTEDEAVRSNLDVRQSIETLILHFHTAATKSLQQNMAPDDDEGECLVQRHVALFVRLIRTTLIDTGDDRDRPGLIRQLARLEGDLLAKDEVFTGESDEGLALITAKVLDFVQHMSLDGSDCFIIEAEMENGRRWEFFRTYEQFYELRRAISAAFGQEADTIETPLPDLPPLLEIADKVPGTDVIYDTMRSSVDKFIKALVGSINISTSSLVRQFLAPRFSDREAELSAEDGSKPSSIAKGKGKEEQENFSAMEIPEDLQRVSDEMNAAYNKIQEMQGLGRDFESESQLATDAVNESADASLAHNDASIQDPEIDYTSLIPTTEISDDPEPTRANFDFSGTTLTSAWEAENLYMQDTFQLLDPPRNSGSNMNREEFDTELSNHYEALRDYLATSLFDENGILKSHKTRDILLRLSPIQIHEMSTYVFDELTRRQDLGRTPPFLPPEGMFHHKRNEARQKLSTLSPLSFQHLATDMFYELRLLLNIKGAGTLQFGEHHKSRDLYHI